MINIRLHRATILLLALAAQTCPVGSAMAGPALTPHAAEYKIKISVLGGKLTTRIDTTETGYIAESVIRATGMSRIVASGTIREKSWFSDNGQRIQPDQYRSTDTLSRDHQTVELDFDWDAETVGGLIDGENFNAELQGEIHDRVSLQYGLMYDLLASGTSGDYKLQDAEELKHLTITVTDEKLVTVPFGTFSALGVQHQRIGSSRTTTLWCVEELGFLPVIIEQHRKGKLQLRAELTNYAPLASAPDDPR